MLSDRSHMLEFYPMDVPCVFYTTKNEEVEEGDKVQYNVIYQLSSPEPLKQLWGKKERKGLVVKVSVYEAVSQCQCQCQ